jgi:hypothetical protein
VGKSRRQGFNERGTGETQPHLISSNRERPFLDSPGYFGGSQEDTLRRFEERRLSTIVPVHQTA